jgi:pre-mRNA-processing factor 19
MSQIFQFFLRTVIIKFTLESNPLTDILQEKKLYFCEFFLTFKIVSGGTDTNVIIYNWETKKNLCTISEHKAAITKVLFRDEKTVITASHDGVAKALRTKDDGKLQHLLNNQDFPTGTASTQCNTKALFLFLYTHLKITSSLLETKMLYFTHLLLLELLPLEPFLQVCKLETKLIFVDTTCVLAHPDGMILGLGASDSTCKIWDVKAWKAVAAVEGHKAPIASIAFSENGYFMATVAEDSVKLWDLRKLKNFHTIELPAKYSPRNLEFDFSGQYLAVTGSEIQIYHGAKFDHVQNFGVHKDIVTSFKWGASAQTFITGSLDRSVKVWGTK